MNPEKIIYPSIKLSDMTVVPGSNASFVNVGDTPLFTMEPGGKIRLNITIPAQFKYKLYNDNSVDPVATFTNVDEVRNNNNPFDKTSITRVLITHKDGTNPISWEHLFEGYTSLTTVLMSRESDPTNYNDYTITQYVNNMSYMFYAATSFNQDISGWDVRNVTDMSYMFGYATKFNNGTTEQTDLNSWYWNVGKVTNMEYMFYYARNFNQDISGWNVGKVTNMEGMFKNTQFFNGNISGWDVRKVTSMSYMFENAQLFNQDISQWVVSNVTYMSGMFAGTKQFNNGDASLNWGNKVSNVTNMYAMFSYAEEFNQDISGWNVSNVTNMSFMFNVAKKFNNGDTPLNWGDKVSNVTNMYAMFYNAEDFNQDISNWNVSNVTDMTEMFAYAKFFNQNISDWVLNPNVTLTKMFFGAITFDSAWDYDGKDNYNYTPNANNWEFREIQ